MIFSFLSHRKHNIYCSCSSGVDQASNQAARFMDAALLQICSMGQDGMHNKQIHQSIYHKIYIVTFTNIYKFMKYKAVIQFTSCLPIEEYTRNLGLWERMGILNEVLPQAAGCRPQAEWQAPGSSIKTGSLFYPMINIYFLYLRQESLRSHALSRGVEKNGSLPSTLSHSI